jgi:nitrite reductase/ring-hydroxylating ferredoxin subunit/Fe-S cluster biogenesis protein NfuA
MTQAQAKDSEAEKQSASTNDPAASLEKLAQAVDSALSAVKDLEEAPRTVAGNLKEALEAFHKEGLVALVKAIKADARGKELLLEALENPAVYALFAMHGIIRKPLHARVLEVLEQVKPSLASHGGDIELVKVEDDVAFVRLHGACVGCSMSAATLRDGVEEAIRSREPEISRVEELKDIAVSGFLTIENARANSGSGQAKQDSNSGWLEGPLAAEIPDSGIVHMESANALIALTDGKLFAYRNACPHMGQPLDGGCVEADILTCPFHGFKFTLASGECLTAPQVQLEPFPLKVVDGRIWVRPA